jgi:hypothetical protein
MCANASSVFSQPPQLYRVEKALSEGQFASMFAVVLTSSEMFDDVDFVISACHFSSTPLLVFLGDSRWRTTNSPCS